MANPSGAAVKGASARPLRYPVQLVIMVDQETADYIAGAADIERQPKGAIARGLIAAGIKAAGS